jgi:hypothetical protein
VDTTGMSLLVMPRLALDPRDGELVVDAVGEEGLLAFAEGFPVGVSGASLFLPLRGGVVVIGGVFYHCIERGKIMR